MDYGHEQTDKKLKRLEKSLKAEYSTAYKEMKKKLQDYLDKFEAQDKKKLALLKENKITEKEYLDWRRQAMITGNEWNDMCNTLAKDMSNTNKIASGMITDNMKDAYTLNANYGMFEIEQGTNANLTFSLYNKETVEKMIKDGKFPVPHVDLPKDKRWNRKKINSAMLQGVLQGESIDKIANRLKSVTTMNQSSAIRNARTYITGAENRGRVDSYKKAEEMGIEVEQEWVATIDERTRESHIALDGMRIEVGGTFPNGCAYPGDPNGEPEEIYNCRCTLVAARKGKVYNDVRPSEIDFEEWERKKQDAQDKYFDKWGHGKKLEK